MAEKTSPWVYVGVGCLGLAVLGVAGIAAVGYFGYRQAKHIQKTVEDPEARTAAAREMLGSEVPPDGYHVAAAFSVPWLMEMAVLSDRKPDPKGKVEGFDERGFIYFEALAFGGKRREVQDFFEGKRDSTEMLRDQGIHIRRGDLLGRGELEPTAEARRLWVCHRGGVETHGAAHKGITTLILVRCRHEDSRLRVGVWFGPDPDPDAKADDDRLAGSVGDPAAISQFLAHFRFCPAAS